MLTGMVRSVYARPIDEAALTESPPVVTQGDAYTGPVCYLDGNHYTVVQDSDDKTRVIAAAQAALDYWTKRGGNDQIEAAQADLDTANTRSYDTPGVRLTSDGDGNYRLATDADLSHHEKFHKQFATLEMEDGAVTRVTPAEHAAVTKLLAELRKGTDAEDTSA